MKTQVTSTRIGTLKTLGFFMIFMLASLAYSPVYGQSQKVSAKDMAQEGKTIKGIVSDDKGPLESASVILKGTNTGTTTNAKGEFTFPKPLNTGDVLLVSFLGYETINVKIKDDTTFLRLTMTEDLLEFVGALNSDKPYKSKRSN